VPTPEDVGFRVVQGMDVKGGVNGLPTSDTTEDRKSIWRRSLGSLDQDIGNERQQREMVTRFNTAINVLRSQKESDRPEVVGCLEYAKSMVANWGEIPALRLVVQRGGTPSVQENIGRGLEDAKAQMGFDEDRSVMFAAADLAMGYYFQENGRYYELAQQS